MQFLHLISFLALKGVVVGVGVVKEVVAVVVAEVKGVVAVVKAAAAAVAQ